MESAGSKVMWLGSRNSPARIASAALMVRTALPSTSFRWLSCVASAAVVLLGAAEEEAAEAAAAAEAFWLVAMAASTSSTVVLAVTLTQG